MHLLGNVRNIGSEQRVCVRYYLQGDPQHGGQAVFECCHIRRIGSIRGIGRGIRPRTRSPGLGGFYGLG